MLVLVGSERRVAIGRIAVMPRNKLAGFVQK
jgi:hypothetical protein